MDQANYDRYFRAKGEFRGQTVPVDSFRPNPWGLYNVHGNVWEWVEDCWHDTYLAAPLDGSAWTTACTDESKHVIRGGSWYVIAQAVRGRNAYAYQGVGLGFRLARTLNP
jgi:formylglycine-generating enzyme required for sulfatase activity